MPIPNDYLKRLEALNGGPLRYEPPADDALPAQPKARPAAPTRTYGREPARPAAPRATPQSRNPVALEEAAPGVEVHAGIHGTAYQVVTPLADLGDEWQPVRGAFTAAFADPDSPLRRRLAARCRLEEVAPHDVVFVDLETTGLSNTPLFLVGIMLWEGDDLVVRQFFARTYAEEAAATALFLEYAADKRLLSSFNGKSFDLPYLRLRAAATGVPFRFEAPHFDLLHESRRVWKGCLPNCKLQTLEQHVCGRPPRYGDIPGSEIPEAYHRYVRTNDARQMVQVLKHNLLDLVTLGDLMARLPEESADTAARAAEAIRRPYQPR